VCTANQELKLDSSACFTGFIYNNAAGSLAECEGASAVLDKNGACCADGAIDVCQNCGTSGKVIDVHGGCCAGVLSAIGECCLGTLDSCGVCNGDGTTCKTKVDMKISPPNLSTYPAQGPITTANYASASSTQRVSFDFEFSKNMQGLCGVASADLIDVESVAITGARRRLLAGPPRRQLAATEMNPKFAVLPDPQASSATTVVTAQSITENLAKAVAGSTNPFKPLSVPQTTSAGVCGNKACEVGEMCDSSNQATCCKADCPYELKTCPVPAGSNQQCGGEGTCIPSSGACNCFSAKGHTGSDCSGCLPGYVQGGIVGGKVTCVVVVDRLVAVVPVPTPTVVPTTAVDDDDDIDWGMSAGVFVAILIATTVLAKFRNAVFTFLGCIKRPRETFVKTAELTQI
jgi:hypothetical protein